MAHLFMMGIIFLIILFFYFLIVQSRKAAYRRIAADWNAQYESRGIFDSGKIIGMQDGRRFEIKLVKYSVGKSSTFFTVFSMPCQNQGLLLSIQGGFLKNFPNWKWIFTFGEKKIRMFFTYLNFEKALIPLDEKCRNQVYGMFSGLGLCENRSFQKGSIDISETEISFSIHGVLKNKENMEGILFGLARIADYIERNPIRK